MRSARASASAGRIAHARDVLARVGEFLHISKSTKIAAALGVTPQAFARWRSSGTVPFERLLQFALRENLSLDWLLLGQGRPVTIASDLDAKLLKEVFAAVHDRMQRLPGQLNLPHMLEEATAIYNSVVELRDANARVQAIQSQADVRAATLAIATAYVIRSRGKGAAAEREAEQWESMGREWEQRAKGAVQTRSSQQASVSDRPQIGDGRRQPRRSGKN